MSTFSYEDLAQRISSALHNYTKETALRLQDTDSLSVSINPDDWDQVRREVGVTWLGMDGAHFMGIKVTVDTHTPPRQPRLVSHWECAL